LFFLQTAEKSKRIVYQPNSMKSNLSMAAFKQYRYCLPSWPFPFFQKTCGDHSRGKTVELLFR